MVATDKVQKRVWGIQYHCVPAHSFLVIIIIASKLPVCLKAVNLLDLTLIKCWRLPRRCDGGNESQSCFQHSTHPPHKQSDKKRETSKIIHPNELALHTSLTTRLLPSLASQPQCWPLCPLMKTPISLQCLSFHPSLLYSFPFFSCACDPHPPRSER